MARIDVRDKPIAITGASSGIGAATAILCARAGMPVALMARRAEKLDAVARTIRGDGGRAVVVVGSVEDQVECDRLVEAAEAEFGPLYSIFANAGIGQAGATWDLSDQTARRMFEVNLFGTLNTLRPALSGFSDRRAGHAVICASCLSKLSAPFYGCYSATKSAQEHFGRALRFELAPRGVRVSTVHPVATATEFSEAARGPDASTYEKERRFVQPPERVARGVLRALRSGKSREIWTSLPARVVFAGAAAFPNLASPMMRRVVSRRADDAPPADGS